MAFGGSSFFPDGFLPAGGLNVSRPVAMRCASPTASSAQAEGVVDAA
jgi:hypothetical protein